ncbi:cell wall-binding repeat-containing protein [Streptomyces sp. AS58]|uniref:cell wall-binding repeat-containing protein n=1 Tax=Streptomyces sp. AS58 TaxID=1519489 RepID=UPI002D21CDE4|nr:cell wall-binding repeat-containing protein [Streptomyces sp. AS58]
MSQTRRHRRTLSRIALGAALVLAAQGVGSAGASARPITADKPKPSTGLVEAKLKADADPGEVPSSRIKARETGKRVELVSERTETSLTFANPDGSFTTESTPGTERIKRDGKWHTVDVTLHKQDGRVAAKHHPSDLILAGGGGSVARSLNAAAKAAPRDLVTLGSGDEQVTLQWKGGLPEPELSGTVARYRDAVPGADVIVEATRTGFEQFVEIGSRPETEDYAYTLPVQAKGLTAKEQSDGSVLFTDPDGKKRAVMPAPIMWDATVDARSGKPANQVPVDMEVIDRGKGQIDLVVTPDAGFLADPNTEYPVTVDPSTSALSNTFDTYVQRGETVDWSTDTELDFGDPGTTNPDGTTRAARSFIHWNTNAIKDSLVTSATLQLFNFHSGNTDCSAQPWTVWSTGAASTSSRWTSQPAWNTEYATSTETKGNPDCGADGWIKANVTDLVQYWASGKVSTGHMGLRTTTSDPKAWKRVNSANNAANQPKLSVTYNFRPATATSQQAGPPFSATDGTWIVSTTTPVLRATFEDPDGDQVNGTFEIRDKATGAKVGDYLVSPWTDPGVAAQVTVPTGLLTDGKTYEFRTSPYDGTHYNLGWSNWTPFTVNTSTAATLTRIAGSTAIDTSVKISQEHWKTTTAQTGNAADAAVIAPSDSYKDGASAIPLAKAKTGPLLITDKAALDSRISAELQRMLPAGKTVYLAGGTITSSVEQAITALGYTVVRLSGATAAETSLAIARDGVVNPKHVAIVSANNWKEALSAASAVASADGAVLLSNDASLPATAKTWLDGLPSTVSKTVVGVGAANAYTSTFGDVVGRDDIETSAMVGDKFMPNPARVALTTTGSFTDAISAGAYAATVEMPLLLNSPTQFDQGGSWFSEEHSATARNVTVIGGTSAISSTVATKAQQAATEKFIDGEIVAPGEEPATPEDIQHMAIEPDWNGLSGAQARGYGGPMNDAEGSFCKWPSRWRICAIAYDESVLAKNLALLEVKSTGFWPGSNTNGGKADAYRHCSWNALMAYEMGSKTAKGFADRHELGPKPDGMSDALAERHHRMDYHNNAWGRFFGQYGKDVGMPRSEAQSVLPGWCLMSVSDRTLTYLWY